MKNKDIQLLKRIVRQLSGIIKEAETETKPRRKKNRAVILKPPKGTNKDDLLIDSEN